MHDTITVRFEPAVECCMNECKRPANWARLILDDLDFWPSCPEHGFQWDSDETARLQSVERYVVWLFGNVGRACVLAQLPDIVYDDESTDTVWQVEYRGDSPAVELRVAWDNIHCRFYAYQD